MNFVGVSKRKEFGYLTISSNWRDVVLYLHLEGHIFSGNTSNIHTRNFSLKSVLPWSKTKCTAYRSNILKQSNPPTPQEKKKPKSKVDWVVWKVCWIWEKWKKKKGKSMHYIHPQSYAPLHSTMMEIFSRSDFTLGLCTELWYGLGNKFQGWTHIDVSASSKKLSLCFPDPHTVKKLLWNLQFMENPRPCIRSKVENFARWAWARHHTPQLHWFKIWAQDQHLSWQRCNLRKLHALDSM